MDIRYPNKCKINIDFDDYLEDIEIPRMLIQPIIENSIVHGLEHCSNKEGEIYLYSKLHLEYIEIIIQDNGIGIEEQKLLGLQNTLQSIDLEDIRVDGTSNIAIINIQRRIKSYYGSEYGITIESKVNPGTKVILKLSRKSSIY